MASPSGDSRRGWFRGLEYSLLLVILTVAWVARAWNLDGLPAGLHGDEAWTGIDARRILAEGWIGPYVPAGLGQPTGPLYLVAALFLWLPDDVATIRLAMAVLGVLGIVFTYLFAREHDGPLFALCAAALLGGSLWHLHSSRVGMMFGTCATALMAGLWAQAVALRRNGIGYWAIAGFVAGLGLYSYNAYLAVVPLYAVPLACALRDSEPAQRTQVCIRGLIFGCFALIAAMPMVLYGWRNPTALFSHHRKVSVLASEAWASGDWSARLAMILDRARYWFEGLLVRGRVDSGDGYGAAGIPLLDPITGVLAALGLMLALRSWRRPLSAVMLAAIPLIALGALLTSGPGAFRRTIALAPIVAMLAATPLARLYDLVAAYSASSRATVLRVLAIGAASVLVLFAATSNLRAYFGPLVHSRHMRWVYGPELRSVSEFLRGVPNGTRVYFFSERWECKYETRRFIAPDVICIDRSRRFRKIERRSGVLDFSVDLEKPSLILLMGQHMNRAEQLRRRYPEVEEEVGKVGGERVFIAFSLQEGDARMVGRPAAKPDSGGRVVRVTDLEPVDVRYDFSPPRVDRAWNGGPLRIGRHVFKTGLGMHAPTEIVYSVPRGATVLVTTVGISPSVADCAKASVQFEIADHNDAVLASSGVRRASDRPVRLRADVAGSTTVTLIAGDGGDGRDCDHANWGNPVFLRDPSGSRAGRQNSS